MRMLLCAWAICSALIVLGLLVDSGSAADRAEQDVPELEVVMQGKVGAQEKAVIDECFASHGRSVAEFFEGICGKGRVAVRPYGASDNSGQPQARYRLTVVLNTVVNFSNTKKVHDSIYGDIPTNRAPPKHYRWVLPVIGYTLGWEATANLIGTSEGRVTQLNNGLYNKSVISWSVPVLVSEKAEATRKVDFDTDIGNPTLDQAEAAAQTKLLKTLKNGELPYKELLLGRFFPVTIVRIYKANAAGILMMAQVAVENRLPWALKDVYVGATLRHDNSTRRTKIPLLRSGKRETVACPLDADYERSWTESDIEKEQKHPSQPQAHLFGYSPAPKAE